MEFSSLVALCLLASSTIVYGHRDQDITIHIRGDECESSNGSPSVSKVGKAGPVGPKGEVGLKGEPGEPCSCDVDDVMKYRYDTTTFTFPRRGQTEDWVRYLPTVPQMSQLTVCYWITPFSIPSGDMFPISYATTANDNTLLLTVNANRIRPHFKPSYSIDGVRFQANQQTHICVSMSSEQRITKVFQDGKIAGQSQINANTKVEGGGALVFGQEQDAVLGSFESGQAFSGSITNFMIYPRVLDDDEIYNIASHCKHPLDVLLRPQLHNVEKYGQAEITVSRKCPTL